MQVCLTAKEKGKIGRGEKKRMGAKHNEARVGSMKIAKTGIRKTWKGTFGEEMWG